MIGDKVTVIANSVGGLASLVFAANVRSFTVAQSVQVLLVSAHVGPHPGLFKNMHLTAAAALH